MKRLLPLLLILADCDAPSHDVPRDDTPAAHRPTLPTVPVSSTPPKSADKQPDRQPDDRADAKGDRATPEAAAEATKPVVPEGTSATVVSITDGDTLRVRMGTGRKKKEERVRLIGIDTPETKNSPRGPQPFADEATAALTELLGRGRVRLVFDVKERDHYGRLLAYVYASDGTFANEAMLRAGWAKALRVPPNVAQAKHFASLEREARRNRAGMWAR